MGMTAGVMISLSFLERVNEAWALKGFWTATIGFAAGAFFMFAMDVTLPHIRFGEREAPNGAALPAQEADNPGGQHRHRPVRLQNLFYIDTGRIYMTGVLLA